VETGSGMTVHSMHYSDVSSTAYQGTRECLSTPHNHQYQALLRELLGHPVHLLQDMIPMGFATLWLWESWQLLSVATLIDDSMMASSASVFSAAAAASSSARRDSAPAMLSQLSCPLRSWA